MKLFFLPILFFVNFAQADFSALDSLLQKNVTEVPSNDRGYQTAFEYEKMKADKDSANLIKTQKDFFKNYKIENLKTKNEALAFWINAYNFFMIVTIYENGFDGNKLKINSVKDLGSFFSPYKIFKEKNITIDNKKYSLDDIEKGTLLGKAYKAKKWKDARIHFAVNCASVGCPPLMNKAYQASTLDNDLDNNIKKALQTKRHFFIADKTLHLTHLFKWYQKDFVQDSKSIPLFLKKFITDASTIQKLDNSTSTEFIAYDWRLNKPSNFK